MSVVQEKNNFEKVLAAIEKEQDLAHDFGAAVTSMVSCEEGVVVGLANGRVVFVAIGASIETTVMSCEQGHSGSVSCLVTMPDGSRVVSGSTDTSVRVWNLADRREEAEFEGHSGSVYCVAITPDGSRVVSGSGDNTVRVWSVAECREEAKFEGHSGSVSCLAITPDGSRVVSGSADSSVRVWSLAERREEAKLEGHFSGVFCLVLTPDGSRVVSGSGDKTVRVWSLAALKEEAKFEEQSGSLSCLAITLDGSRVVSGSNGGTVRVWNLADCREEAKLEGHSERVSSLAITADGSRVISGSLDKTIRVWSLAERKEEIKLEGSMGRLRCLVITPDGSRVVSGSDDERVRVWNLAERREEANIEGHSERVSSLAITPDGSRVISGSVDKTVRVWSLAQRKEEIKLEGHLDNVLSVAITPDGLRVVSGSGDKTVRVWSLAECREEIKFEGHLESVYCLAITPDGSRVVSGSGDQTVRLWSLAQRKEEMKFEGHLGRVYCVGITPDGSRVVSGSGDKTVRVWCLAECREEIKLEGHLGSVYCLAITPDGSRVVSGSGDKTVRVWSLAERKEEIKLEGHSAGVYCLSVTLDGSRVMSGSNDNTLRVWNLAEQREEAQFEGHSSGVFCLAITPDGSKVVSGSSSKAVCIWNVPECRKEIKFQASSISMKKEPHNGIVVPQEIHTPSDLRMAIKEWRNGTALASSIAKRIYPSHLFNGLHICAYFNRPVLLREYLEAGVPLTDGFFGTPLTLALQRNSIKCVDAILQYLVTRLEDPDTKDTIWPTIDMITEDLPSLLKCNSSSLQTFFGLLMQTPNVPSLPDFITPRCPLPLTVPLSSRLIDLADFDQAAMAPDTSDEKKASVLVKFSISLPRWNFTAGSEQSIKLLSAFAECEDKLVLVTPYVSTIIEDKWSRCYAFTLTVTLLYCFLICTLNSIIFLDGGDVFVFGFLGLNSFFMLYESVQAFATGTAYLCELLNWLDTVRGGLSVTWAVLLLYGYHPVKGSETMKHLTLMVVVLCYLRGFTYFRSFKMTRIFVYMTLAVVKEMYSFLIILWYSVLSFGVFSAVLLEFDSMAEAWTNGYNLLMGSADNSTYGFVEWVVFTGATMTNIVIMLNLLVSILGEAYEKTQMSVRENDLHLQLEVVLEYESMMVWRRKDASHGTVIVTCREGQDETRRDEWQGPILQITSTIKSAVEDSFAKVTDQVTDLHHKVTGTVEQKVAGMEGKVMEMEGKVIEKVTGIEGKVAGMDADLAGIKDKVAGIEGQLQVIISLLHSRS